jgi:hypothetical protein
VPTLAQEEKTFEFKVTAPKNMEKGNYPINITVNYGDKGEKVVGSTSLYVDNETTKNESAPRIIVENFKLSKDKIMVGDEVELDLTVKNASTSKSVKNLKAVISTNDGGKAFLPVNQSSSIYVGTLGVGETTDITIPYKVLNNIDGGVYELSLDFEFEDKDYKSFKDKETIYVPVYSEGKLMISDVHVGKELDNSYT